MNVLSRGFSNKLNNTELRENEILKLKRNLAEKYILAMCIILFIYSMVFYFYIKNIFLVFYLLSGIIIIIASWFILRNRLSLKNIIRLYVIWGPIFNFYLMLYFWKYSAGSIVWLVPIPFGVYIFLSRKEVVYYSLYALLTILLVYIISNTFEFHFKQYPTEKLRNTDILLFTSNILIVWLFVYYKDKIGELTILTKIEQKEKITLPVTLDEKEIESAELLFESIDAEIKTNKLFTNPEFNISMLSTILKTNNNYISKAIRNKGYSNFNIYINYLRIEYVKKLLAENDLEKVTLMYIFTEAGFSSQPTFNRAFKQFEGVTPSEYIISNTND